MSKKKVVTIEYEPDMSFQEIATELGISHTRVLELYSQALRKIMRSCNVQENAN